LEKLNIEELLEYQKRLWYRLPHNYDLLHNLLLQERGFEVYIMGHSCGLSDKMLLNSIFESSNPNSVNVAA